MTDPKSDRPKSLSTLLTEFVATAEALDEAEQGLALAQQRVARRREARSRAESAVSDRVDLDEDHEIILRSSNGRNVLVRRGKAQWKTCAVVQTYEPEDRDSWAQRPAKDPIEYKPRQWDVVREVEDRDEYLVVRIDPLLVIALPIRPGHHVGDWDRTEPRFSRVGTEEERLLGEAAYKRDYDTESRT